MNLSRSGFAQSVAGLVYGGPHIQLDEQRFPNLGWTDLIVVVLAWWCRALARTLEGEREPIEVRFMEGPYLAMIGPANGDAMHLELVEAGLVRRVHGEADVLSELLITSVLIAAATAVAECKRRDWWSMDADELVDAMTALKRKHIAN